MKGDSNGASIISNPYKSGFNVLGKDQYGDIDTLGVYEKERKEKERMKGRR